MVLVANSEESRPIFIENGNCLAVPCAHCGCPNTHQQSAESWFRKEDAAECSHVRASWTGAQVDTKNDGNPSARRQGITIRLTCEWCDGVTALDIVQHKGDTLISTRAVEK